jgi:transcriptional regulator GlxA family with amidase domain
MADFISPPGRARVVNVAVACGFKTQQHFARVFLRRMEPLPANIAETLSCDRS